MANPTPASSGMCARLWTVLSQIDHLAGCELGRYKMETASLSETRLAEVGELVLATHFQAPIVKGITFVFFHRVRPLTGIPADRGLPARGFEAGSCLRHLF